MSKKKKNKGMDIVGSISTFTGLGVGIPVIYNTIGGARGLGIHGTRAMGNVSRHAGTSFNVMGIGGVVQGMGGLIGEVKKMEQTSKKKRRY